MAKNVIKEIIIVLLLCLAIILILGILLYEYVPMTKTIPNPVAYTTPEEVKEELETSSDVDESQIVMTYEVDSADLNNYERVNNYQPGKANPFSSYETGSSTEGQNTTTGNSSTGGSSSSNNNGTTGNTSSTTTNDDETTTSGGQFFQDKGTK